LAFSLNNLGLTKSTLRDRSQAEQSFREALAILEPQVAQNPDDVDLTSSLGGIHNNLGFIQEESRRMDDAIENYRQAVEFQSKAFARAPRVERHREFLSKHYYNFARSLRVAGRADEAIDITLKRKRLWPHDPERLFSIAEELARATMALQRHPRPAMSADDCGALAIRVLREAVEVGYQIPPSLASSDSFAALTSYPQFTELVHQ
jgi:tetratricopeptide (TPR) repeat protein